MQTRHRTGGRAGGDPADPQAPVALVNDFLFSFVAVGCFTSGGCFPPLRWGAWGLGVLQCTGSALLRPATDWKGSPNPMTHPISMGTNLSKAYLTRRAVGVVYLFHFHLYWIKTAM